ncbi:MAG: hypothetical protein JST38_04505 [Bacteroidetes bacterium]|nr:hypothetical protein [Bacteroidota bacterium]MBS1940120.1 hypothetical protein [Bacteroidota bacterium]
MTTKKKLQAFFDAAHPKAQYIQAYEENIEFFNELLHTGRAEELDYVLPIKLLKYADPLGQSGQYAKALRVLGEVERDLPKLRGRSKWFDQYDESLTFLIAVNLARMKRYADSNSHFQKLLSSNRSNESYENWYRSNKKALVDRYLTTIMVLGVLGYLLLFLVEWLVPEWNVTWVRTSLLAIALMALAGSSLYKYWIGRSNVQRAVKHR